MPFEKLKIGFCDAIYSISTHGYNHLIRTFPKEIEKFFISRLGVSAQSIRNPHNNQTVFRIATCSAIFRNKRIYKIPEILSYLKGLPVEWVHFGWGDNTSVDSLKKEIAQYSLEKQVTLFGQVDHDFILDYYRNNQVDLILNLSYAEGIPVSLMEALSFGIPGIVTCTVGNPEIVDENCGFQIPVEFTASEVADRIRILYSDTELQNKLQKGAIDMFFNRYEAEKNFTAFCNMLYSRAQQQN